MKHVHFIGIGGSGLSPIARILLEKGIEVSGSDRTLSNFTRDLAAQGIKVYEGHDAANLHEVDLVIRSSAVPDDNPEVVAARQAGIPVMKRSEFLSMLIDTQSGIAIAGTHGKTTTTSMIAWMLTSLGQDPSFVIGGIAKNLGTNAHYGKGGYFVIEADEYDYMFLGLNPQVEVLTIVEHDHPDCFPTLQVYQDAFVSFVHRLQPGGVLLVSRDDEGAREVARKAPVGICVNTYGTHLKSDYLAVNPQPNNRGGFSFDVRFQPAGRDVPPLAHLDLQVPGLHNVRNATAAVAVAHRLELNPQKAADALSAFSGAGRRFDVLGERNGITVIDDYAHHPTEIRATLSAARSRFPGRRIWAVWQPHTYSRTQTLMDEFITSFSDADQVIVTEIYAAREKNPGFSAKTLVEQMKHPSVTFAPNHDYAVEYLESHLLPGDVLLVLSAGDADQISARVFAATIRQERQHD